ncbi:unnamed protein product [Gongylonema pulchrum]|uniref:SHMT domain-containing protein n=1 Tax=Gongylonema pulchrum TaxID=637853 RepID=A0A183F0E4_9BILA|nr:unnamed protein product [Gongylonema pulchrum]
MGTLDASTVESLAFSIGATKIAITTPFLIEPLREAAIGRSEELGHTVREHMEAMEPLVQSSIQAASISYDTKSQTTIFEQCKTVVEAELQMLYGCKDAGGNPKVRDGQNFRDFIQ